jgi:bacterioferritin-associated ferredoxin
MYICVCKGITDTQIRDAVSEGASTLEDVRSMLGVASKCGKCACLADSVINESVGAAAQDLFYAAG